MALRFSFGYIVLRLAARRQKAAYHQRRIREVRVKVRAPFDSGTSNQGAALSGLSSTDTRT
ncbi:hypothetical protein QMN58_30840, partial [Escherichia coli]|nr:hypothetical protein [Escherichia coli]